MYVLEDEKEYLLKMSIFNNSSNNVTTYSREESSKNVLFVNESEKNQVSGSLDDKEVTMISRTLESSSLLTYVTYNSASNSESYNVPFQFKVVRSKKKSVSLGLFSALAFAGVALSNYVTKQNFDYALLYIALSIIAVGLSAGLLYSQFNKK